VTCRGNARGKVFLVDPDRELFLEVLAQVVERFGATGSGLAMTHLSW
jgi:hypothetical protein